MDEEIGSRREQWECSHKLMIQSAPGDEVKWMKSTGPDKAGVQPDDRMATAGRKVLAFYFGRMLREEAKVRGDGGIDEIHDLRVATRRLRSALRTFAPFFKRSVIRPIRRELRDMADALGKVRDLDVMRLKGEKYAEDQRKAEPLAPLIEHLKTQRQTAFEMFLDQLSADNYIEFLEDFSAFLNKTNRVSKREGTCRVRDTLPRLIYAQYGIMRAYEVGLDQAMPDTLHRLRIEAKRFRYLLEAFTEVLGPEAKQVIEAAKTLQDHLGDLQDARVAVESLDEYLTQTAHTTTVRRAINGYKKARETEQRDLHEQVGEAWNNFTNPEIRRALALSVAVL
jgi:CHAD domain-containing protein